MFSPARSVAGRLLLKARSKGAAPLARAYSTSSNGGDKKTVTVYRVEGKGNQRILMSEDGTVQIPIVLSKKGRGAERNLYLNCGDESRAQVFLAQRRQQFDDNEIKAFDVDADFVDALKAEAVAEADRAQHPDKPVVADPTKANNQFGLGADQIDKLRKAIVPGSGRKVNPGDKHDG